MLKMRLLEKHRKFQAGVLDKGNIHICWMEFGTVYWCYKSHGSHSFFAGFCEVPPDHSKVLRCTEKVSTAVGPGKILNLSYMSTKDSGKTVGFDIEEDDSPVNLRG